MGEALDRLEEFRPDGMASRILGMGDIVGLMKDFEEVVDEEKAEEDAVRMLKGKFDMQDFLEQIGVLQKMGSLKDLFEKIPFFAGALPEGVKLDDRELVQIEAMISSMTDEERRHPERFVVTSWEEVVEGGKRKKKRSAYYETEPAARASRAAAGRKENEVEELLNVRDDAADDGAARRVDRPARQDPRLQAVRADEEDDGRRREPAGQHDEHARPPSAATSRRPKRNVDRAKEKRKRKDARKARKKGRQRR